MLILLLLPLLAQAAWKEVWQVKLPGTPRAAFYEISSGKILVSAQLSQSQGKEAFVERIDLQGKLEEEPIAKEEGEAGPLRAFGGHVYWALGKKVVSFPAEGGRMKAEGEASFPVLDLALNGKGEVFVAGDGGVGKLGKAYDKPAATGLFFWVTDLFSLREGKSVKGAGKTKKLCSGDCHGLERAPDGAWITAKGNEVLKNSKVLVKGASPAGRIAYAYQRDSKYDLLIVPYPEEKTVKAYQAEGAK
jgi:hypothetical protein